MENSIPDNFTNLQIAKEIAKRLPEHLRSEDWTDPEIELLRTGLLAIGKAIVDANPEKYEMDEEGYVWIKGYNRQDNNV